MAPDKFASSSLPPRTQCHLPPPPPPLPPPDARDAPRTVLAHTHAPAEISICFSVQSLLWGVFTTTQLACATPCDPLLADCRWQQKVGLQHPKMSRQGLNGAQNCVVHCIWRR